MIVTIDGPAGAGKSTIARELARRLGYRFLDTGAMYRAVAVAAQDRGLDLRDWDALARMTEALQIDLDEDRTYVDGNEVTHRIRSPEVTAAIHHVADNPAVRAHLVKLQRRVTEFGDVVTEGRDQGTVVFPDAECKLFLTATADERARRRHRELLARGQQFSIEEVLRQQQERDRRDRERPVGRLMMADDATEIVTDGMTPEEVLSTLEAAVRQRQAPA